MAFDVSNEGVYRKVGEGNVLMLVSDRSSRDQSKVSKAGAGAKGTTKDKGVGSRWRSRRRSDEAME